MALADHVLAVQLARQRAGLEAAFLRAQAHRAAEVGAFVALFDFAGGGGPFGDQRDHRMRRRCDRSRWSWRLLEAGDIAREIDDRRVHAVADAEIRHAGVRARNCAASDLALEAALAEAARHEDGIDVAEQLVPRRAPRPLRNRSSCRLTRVGLLDAAMTQRLAERLVGILVLDVLADDGDVDLVFRMLDGIDRALPARTDPPGLASSFRRLTTMSSSPCCAATAAACR